MSSPMTLPARRAALKRLLASGESAIDAYERVLEGASEKDRRSLFKSVPFARLVPPAVEWEWDAVPENTVHMCAFLRAAHSRGAWRQGVVTCCRGGCSPGLVNVYWP